MMCRPAKPPPPPPDKISAGRIAGVAAVAHVTGGGRGGGARAFLIGGHGETSGRVAVKLAGLARSLTVRLRTQMEFAEDAL